MSLYTDLRAWLKENPPRTMPLWPGARTTNRVDIRSSQAVLDLGGSPLHPGVDRSQGREFVKPFDGRLSWRRTGGDIGSFLRLVPHGLQMEMHMFHTAMPDARIDEYEEDMRRGDPMPVYPSNSGLSRGIHLHEEVVVPYDEELREWIMASAETIYSPDGSLDTRYVIAHCRRHDLDRSQVLLAIPKQIARWGISEMCNRFMVRQWVGGDRVPLWGPGKTMHVDSQWLLNI